MVETFSAMGRRHIVCTVTFGAKLHKNKPAFFAGRTSDFYLAFTPWALKNKPKLAVWAYGVFWAYF